MMRASTLVIAMGLAILVGVGGPTAAAQGKRAAAAELSWMGAQRDKVQAGKAVRPDGRQVAFVVCLPNRVRPIHNVGDGSLPDVADLRQ